VGGAIACATPYIERHDGGLPLQGDACICGRLGAPCVQAAPYLEQARLRDDERARLGVRHVAPSTAAMIGAIFVKFGRAQPQRPA